MKIFLPGTDRMYNVATHRSPWRPCIGKHHLFSVVICTHNRPQALESCLEAVARIRYPQFDIVVVDNAPTAPLARTIADRWGARYEVEPAIGLSRARNRGARSCRTPLVAFLDDDAQPDPAWLSALAPEFDDPAVIAVAGRTLGTGADSAAGALFQRVGGFDRGRGTRSVVDAATPGWFEQANFGGIGTGANMAFRRAAFDLWPGFDCRLGLGTAISGSEENHAFFKLIDLGYRVCYAPEAIVRHPFPRTWNDLRVRQLRTIGSGPGYFAFLLRTEPRYRRALLAIALSRVRHKPAEWRRAPRQYRCLLPLSEQILAMVACTWRSLLASG